MIKQLINALNHDQKLSIMVDLVLNFAVSSHYYHCDEETTNKLAPELYYKLNNKIKEMAEKRMSNIDVIKFLFKECSELANNPCSPNLNTIGKDEGPVSETSND